MEIEMKRKKLLLFTAIVLAGTLFTGKNVTSSEAAAKSSPAAPKFFRGVSKSGKKIQLKWKKSAVASGYTIYKNGRKAKTIKGQKKTKWIDKKVKAGKVYKYRITAYKKMGGKKTASQKSYQIKVAVTNKKSKKTNAYKLTGAKSKYVLHFNSSKKIKLTVKANKKEKKKKLVSKKIVWSSSNNALATVDKNGVIRTNNQMKTGCVYIYARAHNGITKSIRVEVTNFATPAQFKNMYAVNKEIKPIVTTYKKELTDIAAYFEFVKPNSNVAFDIDDYGNLKKTPSIVIDKKVEESVFKILKNVPVTIEIRKTYLAVRRVIQTSYGTTITCSIIYGFTDKAERDYDNDYSYLEIAPRWKYQLIEQPTE